jgi:hypothetical protein
MRELIRAFIDLAVAEDSLRSFGRSGFHNACSVWECVRIACKYLMDGCEESVVRNHYGTLNAPNALD